MKKKIGIIIITIIIIAILIFGALYFIDHKRMEENSPRDAAHSESRWRQVAKRLAACCGGVIVQQGAPPRRLRQGGATRMQGRMEAIRGNGFSERAPMRALGRRLHAGHAQERTAFGPPRCGPQAIYGFRPATPRVASSQWPAASGLPRPFRGRAPRACSEAAPRPSSAWNWHP